MSTPWSRREVVTLAMGAFVRRPSPVAHIRVHDWSSIPQSGFEPWLEIDAAAIRSNVEAVARMVGGRPIVAVVKNNAYGLGLDLAGPIVDRLVQVRVLAGRCGPRKPWPFAAREFRSGFC